MAHDVEALLGLTEDYKSDYQPDVEAGLSRLKRRMQLEHTVEPSPAKVVALPRRSWSVLRVAAAVALLVGAGFVLQNYLLNTTNTRNASTFSGQTKMLELADGTQVRLNEGSTITYPDAFNGSKRVVELKGEAFFDVAHNPEQAFIIKTKQAETKVLGTSFNVRAYDKEATTSVHVKTGKVSFRPYSNSKAIILEAGYSGVFDAQTQQKTLSKKANPNAYAWHSQELSFKGVPLREAIQDIEHYFGVTIKYSPQVANCDYTHFSVLKNPKLESLLNFIETSYSMDLKKEGNKRYNLKGGSCQ